MLEVFVELILFLILFYCLTIATVKEDYKDNIEVLGEQLRKKNRKRRNCEPSSHRSYLTEELYSKHSDIKRQQNPFKNLLETSEELKQKKDVFQKFKDFPFMSLNQQNLKQRKYNVGNCFIDKSVGSMHIQILENGTNTDDISKRVNSGTQTTIKIKRSRKAVGDRDKGSLVTFTPSFHAKLEQQLQDLIHLYWDQYVMERINTNRTFSTSHVINSKSFSHSDISSYSNKSDKNLNKMWSNLLEDITVMGFNEHHDKNSLSLTILNQDIKKSYYNTFGDEDNKDMVLGEDYRPSKTGQKAHTKTKHTKSIKGLLKKELAEILSTDQSMTIVQNPSCLNQRVEVTKSIQQLLENGLTQMDYQTHKSQDQELLRSTSYQALVDNLQYIANFIQTNCSSASHSEPLSGIDCFETLQVSKSRFLLNKQLVKALRSKVSHSSNYLTSSNENNSEDEQVAVVRNELGET